MDANTNLLPGDLCSGLSGFLLCSRGLLRRSFLRGGLCLRSSSRSSNGLAEKNKVNLGNARRTRNARTFFAGARLLAVVVFLVVVAAFALGLPARVFLITGFFTVAALALVVVAVFFGAAVLDLAAGLAFVAVVEAFALVFAAAVLGLGATLEAGLFYILLF